MLDQIRQSSPNAAARIEQLDVPLDAAMFILMDELVGRVAELQKSLIPGGHLRSIIISVTDAPQVLGETDWVSAVLYNDGPSNVYLFDEYQMPRVGYDAPIKPNEGLPVDFRARIGKGKYVVCAPGESAEARVFRMW